MSDRSKKPTQRDHSGPVATPPSFDDAATEVEDSARFPRRQSEPIQVVSMKTPMDDRPADPGSPAQTPIVPRPKLRAISEITPLPHALPRNLGYLAPPRDSAEVRSRRVRDVVIGSSLAVILASAVALAIWFLGR